MENPQRDVLVLVTGGTGFVGLHSVLSLLNAGNNVRTTLRKLNRQSEVIEAIRLNNAEGLVNLSFVEADLATTQIGIRRFGIAVIFCTLLRRSASRSRKTKMSSSVPRWKGRSVCCERPGTAVSNA